MVFVYICVGSSCHLKNSEAVVKAFQDEIETKNLEDDVILSGSFCFGKCNREGVTVQVDDDLFEGVTKESAKTFFNNNILSRIES
ncbi:MAG: (2Fe-2S) ferredoxin domain-containing protein [Clostridia bacterium]|nr:(2Fe-2S) ferredoxin domain-containing protein [Clostridia bacterium]